MQLFFMDYGLWLLIALLVVIGVIFLLSGRKPTGAPPPESRVEVETAEPETLAPPAQPLPAASALQPAAIAPLAVEPTPVEHAPIEPVSQDFPPPPPAEEAPIPVSPAAVAAPEADDDLLKLKGVGPKLRTQLIELGVTRFAQIAAWTDADIATVDAKLGAFKGRPVRDQWVDQAKYLAAGDIAGFEAKYGKL